MDSLIQDYAASFLIILYNLKDMCEISFIHKRSPWTFEASKFSWGIWLGTEKKKTVKV